MQISEAESAVMEALWREQPLTAEEIVALTAVANGWRETTVKTLINRLLRKGAIAAEPDGRRYRYRPLIARSDYVHASSVNLLERLFDGRVAPLVAHFSERRRLSKRDVAELKRLIETLDDDD